MGPVSAESPDNERRIRDILMDCGISLIENQRFLVDRSPSAQDNLHEFNADKGGHGAALFC